jgi:hypothetical protein
VPDLNRLVTSFTERVPAVAHAAVLAVLAAPESDLGNVAYEMSLLGERAGPSLDRVTPRAWWRSYRRSYDSPG